MKTEAEIRERMHMLKEIAEGRKVRKSAVWSMHKDLDGQEAKA